MQTDEAIVGHVKKIRVQYEHLLHGDDPDVTSMTPGQMLLMGFHGLFSRLDDDFRFVGLGLLLFRHYMIYIYLYLHVHYDKIH